MAVHDWLGFHRDDGFQSQWAVAQGTVWSFGVAVFPLLVVQNFGLKKTVEYLPVQQFIPEAGVEALAVSVHPRRSWLDVCRFGADHCDPISDGLGKAFCIYWAESDAITHQIAAMAGHRACQKWSATPTLRTIQ